MIPDSVFEFDINGSPNQLPWFDEVATACRYFYYCSSALGTSNNFAYLADIQGETMFRIYSTGHLTYSNPDYEARIAERLSSIDHKSPSYSAAILSAIEEFSPSRTEFITALKNLSPLLDQQGKGSHEDLDRLLAAVSGFSVDTSSNVICSIAERFVCFDGSVRNDFRCWYEFDDPSDLFGAMNSIFWSHNQKGAGRNGISRLLKFENARKLFGVFKSLFK